MSNNGDRYELEPVPAEWQQELDELRARVEDLPPDPEDDYELAPKVELPEAVTSHFDEMLERMQTPEARMAVARVFAADPREYAEIIREGQAAKAKGNVAMKQSVRPPEKLHED